MNIRDFSTLQIALAISVAAHAALLAVRFSNPQAFDRLFQDDALDVVLVNTKTNEARPEKAQAIAQTSLAGGGDLDKGMASSPLPPSAFTTLGDTLDMTDSAEAQQRQIEEMQTQQQQVLLQLKKELAAMPPVDKTAPPEEQAAQQRARQQKLDLLAAIDRRISEENKKPRKRYLSPSTQEAVYATYLHTLIENLNERGTQNFPEAEGKKLYGELSMFVFIQKNGTILGTEIKQSSGNPVLDRRAQAIAMSLQSAGALSPAMLAQGYDQYVPLLYFKFARDNTLATQQVSSPGANR